MALLGERLSLNVTLQLHSHLLHRERLVLHKHLISSLISFDLVLFHHCPRSRVRDVDGASSFPLLPRAEPGWLCREGSAGTSPVCSPCPCLAMAWL